MNELQASVFLSILVNGAPIWDLFATIDFVLSDS